MAGRGRSRSPRPSRERAERVSCSGLRRILRAALLVRDFAVELDGFPDVPVALDALCTTLWMAHDRVSSNSPLPHRLRPRRIASIATDAVRAHARRGSLREEFGAQTRPDGPTSGTGRSPSRTSWHALMTECFDAGATPSCQTDEQMSLGQVRERLGGDLPVEALCAIGASCDPPLVVSFLPTWMIHSTSSFSALGEEAVCALPTALLPVGFVHFYAELPDAEAILTGGLGVALPSGRPVTSILLRVSSVWFRDGPQPDPPFLHGLRCLRLHPRRASGHGARFGMVGADCLRFLTPPPRLPIPFCTMLVRTTS